MQSIPRGESFGAKLGTGLGELAGYKIGQLIKKHQQEQERSQFAKVWEPILGQQSTHFLSSLGPEERKLAMQNINSLIQLNEPPSSREQVSGMQSLGVAQQQGQHPQQQFDRDYFIRKALGQPDQQDSLLSGLQGGQTQQAQQQMQQPQVQQQITPDKARLIADLLSTPQEKAARAKERLAQEKNDLSKQKYEHELSKEAREFSKPYREKARKAEANIRDYNDLIKRAESGNLRAGTSYQILDKLGLQDFWRNPDTEIAQKLIARLAQNVNGVFGSNARIGVFLEKTFQRSLPSLINTPEGIAAISYMNKAVDEGEIVRNDIRKQILRENGNRVTADMDDLIEERAAPLIQQIDENAARDAENAVRSKLKNTGKSYNDLPPAAQFNGKTAVDDKTGQKFKSNGSKWIPIK